MPQERPRGGAERGPALALGLAGMLLLLSGCSVRKFALNKVGDALSSGGTTYERDEDMELVGGALPFSLKLVESLLDETPRHRGLLLTACRGFTSYSYAYVHFDAERLASEDLDRARELRRRASRLYLRGFEYGIRWLELDHPGFRERLLREPQEAAKALGTKRPAETVSVLYWTAASLGQAISAAKNDANLLARVPEVEALLDRAFELDESWEAGLLHEFEVMFAPNRPGGADEEALARHYQRALELSAGNRASLYLAYAETRAIPAQDRAAFLELVNRALAVDPEATPEQRLVNLIAQRRARWLLGRVDELFLE